MQNAEVKTASEETIVVDDGDSSQASYGSANRLVFVSAKRATHQQPQIYERDLDAGVDRRITFQNGVTARPRLHPKEDWILYASSTDEVKEAGPLFAATKPSKLPAPFQDPTEIYVHVLAGLEIRRVTERPGFDGEARFTGDGRALTWTRIVNDRAQIVQAPLAGGAPHVLAGLGDNPTSFVGSADGKAQSWIDWDGSFGVSRLRLRRGKQTIDVAGDMIVTKSDNEFTPDSKHLLWAQKDAQSGRFELWSYDLDRACLQRFAFGSEAERRHPVVSPDMKWLTYTLVKQGRSRIARVPFVKATGPCPVTP